MASRSSTVIISSAPIAKVGRLLTLTIAEISGTWLPFSLADGPLAPKCDSHHLETGPRIWLSPEEVLAPFYITQNSPKVEPALCRFHGVDRGRAAGLQSVYTPNEGQNRAHGRGGQAELLGRSLLHGCRGYQSPGPRLVLAHQWAG